MQHPQHPHQCPSYNVPMGNVRMHSEFRQEFKTVELLPHSVCPLGFFVFHFILNVWVTKALEKSGPKRKKKCIPTQLEPWPEKPLLMCFFCKHHRHPNRYHGKPSLQAAPVPGTVLDASILVILFHLFSSSIPRNHSWSHFAKEETDAPGGLAPKQELAEWRAEPRQ